MQLGLIQALPKQWISVEVGIRLAYLVLALEILLVRDIITTPLDKTSHTGDSAKRNLLVACRSLVSHTAEVYHNEFMVSLSKYSAKWIISLPTLVR